MSVYRKMESALNSAMLTAFPTTDIYFENQPVDESAAVPFLVCNFLPAAPDILESMYNGRTRYPAVYQITISVARGSGKYQAYTMLETIQAAFYRGLYLENDGVTTRIVSVSPEAGRGELGIFEIPVTVSVFATE